MTWPPIICAAKIFLNFTYKKLNQHGVGPELLWDHVEN